jgi:flagellar biosynthetic protein FliQ
LPLLGIALAVTILMSIIQVVTSMQENTISTVPRLLAVGVAAVVLAPWMLQRLSLFTHQVFEDMARLAK